MESIVSLGAQKFKFKSNRYADFPFFPIKFVIRKEYFILIVSKVAFYSSKENGLLTTIFIYK